MDFQTAVRTVFAKYADFSGRARRSEYWYFVLFNFLVSLVITGIGGMIFRDWLVNAFNGLYSLCVIVPALAVLVRRLHDTGKSGWFALFALIPVVGVFIEIYFLVQDSDPGRNLYGPNPKDSAIFY